jgi:hypothetical protein
MAIRTFNSVGGFSVGEVPTTIIYANGDITTGNANVSANTRTGNLLTDNLLYANGVPWDFQLPAGANNYVQYNDNGQFGGDATFQFDSGNSLLTVGNITLTGNIEAQYFVGNFSGNISGNITAAGSNTQVQFNDAGAVNGSAAFTFNKFANILTVNGNISSGNADLGNLATANYFTGTLTTAAQPNITSVGTMQSITMAGGTSISGGNLVSATYLTGTLTTQTQPNITSVGTLVDLSVSGNISAGGTIITGGNLTTTYLVGTLVTADQPNVTTVGNLANLVVLGNANVDGNLNAGNLNVTSRVISNLIPSPTNTYTLGASGNIWESLWVTNVNIGSTYIRSSGNVILMDAANVANNMSTDSLTVRSDGTVQGNMTISGNLTVAGNTTYINVQNLDIKDPLISMGGSGNGGNATAYDGMDRGMVLLNYYSNGSGPVNQAFIWKTGSNEFQAISQINNITNEVVTASAYGNVRGNVFIGNLEGYVLTAAQGNITSLGTLANLTIAGNLVVNTTANLNALIASNLIYPVVDGSNGQHLTTYGNGQLYWATVDTSQLSNGTSNVEVYNSGNIEFSAAGNANVFTVTGTGTVTNGTANITGNLTSGNAYVANLIIANSTIRSNSVTTTSTSANQTIANVPYAGLRGVIFDVKAEEVAGGKYSIATLYAVHDGSTADYSVSGSILMGGATGTLVVNLIGSNLALQVTPASSNSTVFTTQFRTI